MVAIHGIPATDLSGVPGSLTTIESKVDGVQTDVTTIDGKVDTVVTDTGTTIPGVLSTIETKVDTAITDIGTVDGKVDTLTTKVDNAQTDITTIDGKADTIITNLGTVETKVDNAQSDITVIDTNVDTINTNLTVVQNISLTIPNLSSNTNFQGIKSTTNNTLTTIHSTKGTGFAHLSYFYPPAAASDGQIQVFVGGTTTAHKVIDIGIEPGTHGLIACFPFWFTTSLTIKAKSDGSESLDVFITQCKSVQGESSQTIQVCEDTTIQEAYPTTNYGNHTQLEVRKYGSIDKWTLIKFDLSSLIGEFIESAVVSLQVNSSVAAMADGKVYRILTDWEEMEATWNECKTGVNWGAPGMLYGTDFTTDYYWTGDIGNRNSGEWLSMDLTTMFREWCQGGKPNYGLVLAHSVDILRDVLFHSNQYPTPASRPLLTYKKA